MPNGVDLTGNLWEGRNILEEGVYSITASKNGYADETINVSLDSSKSIEFNLHENVAPLISVVSPINSSTTNSFMTLPAKKLLFLIWKLTL